ncbi:MAG: ceramidase domain-containing protein [Pseudomonadota bacterium]
MAEHHAHKIFNYCERAQDPSFWAEPWNAVTNAAFLIAAGVCLVIALRARRLDGPVLWLILVTSAIGVGSFLFHTYAETWAALADVIPIGIFILSYFVLAMRCYAGFSWGRSFLLMVGFIVALVAVSWLMNTFLRGIVGGSVSYGPALLALFVTGLWLNLRGHPAGTWMMVVSGIFLISLTARSVDYMYCDSLPIGSHWLWHILNGVVLGGLTLALIRHGTDQSRNASI